jgi:hypothetical protein
LYFAKYEWMTSLVGLLRTVDLSGLLLALVAVSRGRMPNFSGLVIGVGGRDILKSTAFLQPSSGNKN